MRFVNWILALLMLGSLAACGDEAGAGDNPPGDDDDDMVGAACADQVPTGDFSALPGEGYVRPFQLPSCLDGGEMFDIYGDSFCSETDGVPTQEAKVTFLVMAAGWCEPCKRETEAIGEYLYDEYSAKGVRFVQVVVEDRSGAPADLDYCNGAAGWVEELSARTNIRWPTLVDDPINVAIAANVLNNRGGIPYGVIMADDGFILADSRGCGEPSACAEEIAGKLDDALEFVESR